MFLNLGNRRFDDDEEAFQDYIGCQHSGSKRARPSCSKGRGRKKMTTKAEGISATIIEVALALKHQENVSMVSQTFNFDTVNNEEEFSLATCQRIVDSMSVLPTTYVKTMKYLMDNKEWYGIFRNMSEEYRWS